MNSAIIVAAGRGTRMGANIDKIFIPVAGRPVVAHTWSRFDRSSCIDEILLVIRSGNEEAFREMAKQFSFKKPWRTVAGGAERQDSVWNGLEALALDSEWVAIQDAARPCTTDDVIRATFDAAKECGAAVAAQAVTDTIKLSADGKVITEHLDRSKLFSVQTPQTFRVPVIRAALSEVRKQGLSVTDDTAACALIGQPVRLVLSAHPNPKVTHPSDVVTVEQLLLLQG